MHIFGNETMKKFVITIISTIDMCIFSAFAFYRMKML